MGKKAGGEDMSKARCKRTDEDSFFGDFIYERIIPKGHFLVQLKGLVDWPRYTRKLIKYYKGNGEVGQAPYDPTLILKMLLLAYLYNISGRQTEVVVNENLPVKFFVGLAVDEKSPGHSTLTWFKSRLIEGAGISIYEALFDEIIKVAQEKGVKFGKLQIVDSVHLVAESTSPKTSRGRKTVSHRMIKTPIGEPKGTKWWKQRTEWRGKWNTFTVTKTRSVSMPRRGW
jgi:transposase